MGIKILLADDSVTAQNMGKKILTEAGHEVITVNNGAAAAKKIAEIKPELVLLDVFMPGYSGLELCERLRNSAETAKIAVLLTVGRMEPYSPQDGARVKADGVIVKPFEASDLTAAVDRLAEKAKPAKQAPADYGRTIKISSLPEVKEERPSDTQELPPYQDPSQPKVYQETVRLDSAQVAAMLNSAAASPAELSRAAVIQEQATGRSTVPFADEAQIASRSQAVAIPGEANTPVFGTEFMAETHAVEQHPAPMPSYMAQYLTPEAASSESPDFAESALAKTPQMQPHLQAAAENPSLHQTQEQLSPTIPISDDLLMHRFRGNAAQEAPGTPVEGLEFTAAPPVGDVPIVHEPGFEPTLQSFEPPTFVIKDPALVTDPHHATIDFATQFGTNEAELPDATSPFDTAAASTDEFEARLKAAMADYEVPSQDSLQSSTVAEIERNDIHKELFGELESPTFGTSDSAIEPLSGLGSPVESFIGAPVEALDFNLPSPEPPIQEGLERAKSNVIEFHSKTIDAAESLPATPEAETVPESASSAPGVESHSVSLDTRVTQQPVPEEPVQTQAVASTMAPVAGEPSSIPEMDEAVIERIRAGFSGLPTDHLHQPEPAGHSALAMAAAASTASAVGSVAPAPFGQDAEQEIARALAATVAPELPAEPSPMSIASDDEAQLPNDANKLAAAVERVMKRELPTLIWKIMAELDLRKR